MKRKLWTLLFLLMTTFGTLVVTGCGSSLTTYFTSDLPKSLNERGQANKDIAKSLLDAGFIDKTMYADLCNQIDLEVKAIIDKSIVTDDDSQALQNAAVQAFSKATSKVYPRKPTFVEYEDDSGNTQRGVPNYKLYEKTKKDGAGDTIGDYPLSYFVASNFIISNFYNGENHEDKYPLGTWTDLPKDDIEPINFFGGQDNIIETLNDRFRADMYVLDAEAIASSGKSIDEVFAAIKTAVDKDDISGVTHFFKKLTDSDGNAMTLMPADFNLIGDSTENESQNINVPGKDLVMTQKLLYVYNDDGTVSYSETDTDLAVTKTLPVLTLRFTEFNQKAFDTLTNTININSGAYYFENLNSTESSGGQTTRCYVLTYPISVIDKFTLDENTGNVTAEFNDDSGMAVSIQTGKLISYDYDTDGTSFKTTCHEVTTSDPYLTMNFDASVGDEKSSLVCDGYRTYTINTITYDNEGNEQTASKTIVVPRIILRDYLEATWAPGSVTYDETAVVFGRKIRFRTDSTFWVSADALDFNGKTYNNNTLQYNINNKDWCASFIDIDGEEVGSLTKLYITDFCDIDALAIGLGGSATDTTQYVEYGNDATFQNKTAVANTIKYMNNNKNGIPPSGSRTKLEGMFGADFANGLSTNQPYNTQQSFNDKLTEMETLLTSLGGSESDAQSSSNKWANYIVKHFREAGISASTKECAADNSEMSPTQDKLASTTDVTSIKVSMGFPSKYIGSTDLNNTSAEVQRFYCVITTKAMFDSALYSDWINSTASKESLTWWNGYLADHGYDYTIGADEVSAYVQTNYKYELSQQGAIILDLDTINKIQEIYDDEDADSRSSLIRTIFVVLGIFLIAYAMILMLCWVIDTNVDLGFSLTNKVTLGHWIAIQYDEELPSYNNEGHCYVDGKHMLIKCLIMVAVAIVIIRVDASEIILVLVNTFGKIASYVEDMIRGLV